MNKIILKFIFLFTPLFKRFGVDVQQLEIILQTKLAMDDRRPFAFAGRRQKQKVAKNSSLGAMFTLAFMGTFLIYFLYAGQATIFGNVIYISFFMVLIAVTLISDFTSVLMDVRDNFIILPRPVNDTTFTISRILHITIHVFKLVFALSLPALIFEGYVNGAAGVVIFFIEIQLATVFGIFLVNLLYLAVLNYSTPEKFNNVISYFQIAFSVIIFGAYQLLPRMTQLFDLNTVDPLRTPYNYILPPVWFASFFDIIIHPASFSITKLILAATGIVMPFVAVWTVVKFLAPGFNKRLSAITPNGEESTKPVTSIGAESLKGHGLPQKLAVLLSNNNVEQAGFKLTWWLTSRYRDFKVKVYPSFAFVPVYCLYIIFFGPRGGAKQMTFKEITLGKSYFMLLYSVSFVLVTVIQQVSQSEKYKAAWIMFTTSHNEPGKIISGMYQAILCKYVVPLYAVVSAITLFIWGPVILNDIFLAFSNTLIYGIILSIYTVEYLPFSQPIVNQAGRVFVRIAIMFTIAAVGFVHYLISDWEWVVNGTLFLSAAGCWLLFNYFRKRSWEALESDYS